MARHSIIGSIPQTAQNDPDKFPAYDFREYPKMMTMKADQAYIDDWMSRHASIDERSGKTVYPGGRPRLGAIVAILNHETGEPYTVNDEDEETAFREQHLEALEVVSGDAGETISRLEDENARLKALIEENDKLRADKKKDDETRKPDKKPPAKPKAPEHKKLPAALK